ncbi:hypothetical protein LUZ60_010171 [Juncus effusus]|nr:hypothetical protein LUZ60_010171 [Juncus effusus]
MEDHEDSSVMVRNFDPERDSERVESVERMCEVGPSGKISLFTDLLGDPLCRIRNSPSFLMLVAEETSGPVREIVGLVRGCVKTVTCGKKTNFTAVHNTKSIPIETKVAYLLGLRVSPSHRRRGIGLKLVQQMEKWFKQMGAEYSYMATDKDNEASVKLFTERCGYSKFRTPVVLVNPVYRHHVPVRRGKVNLIRLSPHEAETLYRNQFGTTEFFPKDIEAVLNNPLNLGTFLAVPAPFQWNGTEHFLSQPPHSWAVLSVWNSKNAFQMEVRGASRLVRALAQTSRFIDRVLPWLKIPSFPNLFRPFGFYFLYGLGGAGQAAQHLMRALCAHAHNLAREGGCSLVATELASCEPILAGIPHWERLSFSDLWCVKRLSEEYTDTEIGDWTKAKPPPSIFVDPREV